VARASVDCAGSAEFARRRLDPPDNHRGTLMKMPKGDWLLEIESNDSLFELVFYERTREQAVHVIKLCLDAFGPAAIALTFKSMGMKDPIKGEHRLAKPPKPWLLKWGRDAVAETGDIDKKDTFEAYEFVEQSELVHRIADLMTKGWRIIKAYPPGYYVRRLENKS